MNGAIHRPGCRTCRGNLARSAHNPRLAYSASCFSRSAARAPCHTESASAPRARDHRPVGQIDIGRQLARRRASAPSLRETQPRRQRLGNMKSTSPPRQSALIRRNTNLATMAILPPKVRLKREPLRRPRRLSPCRRTGSIKLAAPNQPAQGQFTRREKRPQLSLGGLPKRGRPAW